MNRLCSGVGMSRLTKWWAQQDLNLRASGYEAEMEIAE